ncbi:alkylation response protein AidB-like acyl-CoA dehydrogenase [Methylopila capsulata]|uniref:Dibenzothiophene monooxygenase n=1 Tax=Methylopila capsulata TaxID=61654 RepID=A0A9W6IPL2_9HYPH|nr:acyl-CoA dehydrogenase family protein [Methylopila capsulata]MBM7851125.1 alkylation response protein AidB-like acyl-CoA dehydrogenase [Methylopila capsulata]GLK54182.1 acyl-CoA dehydrogenase [Methylopila capsulata]
MTAASPNLRIVAPRLPTPGSRELAELLAAVAEGASERDATRTLPFAQIDLLRAARFGALRLRKEEGGAGLTLRELLSVVIELAAADPNVAHIVRNHFGYVERFALPSTGDRHLRWAQLVAGGAIVGLAMNEINARSLGGTSFDTRLVARGDGFTLAGVKYFSTGSLFSDYVMIRAQDEADRFVSAIVPADRKGLTLEDDWDGLGQRLTGTGTTRLDDVRVAADEVIFDDESEGFGFARPYTGSYSQLFLTAIVAGILRNAAEDAAELVRTRKRSFSFAPAEHPADDPILQQAVGEIASSAFAAEAAVLAAAEALDRAVASRVDGAPDIDAAHAGALAAAKAKVVVDALAIRAGSQVFDAGGASATKKSANLDRHWRNARTLASHNPAAYKARSVGQHLISGERLPLTGFY